MHIRAARARRVLKYCRQFLIKVGHGGELLQVREELTEIERLADIGKAAEIAFKHGYFIYDIVYGSDDSIAYCNKDTTVEDFLEWLKIKV